MAVYNVPQDLNAYHVLSLCYLIFACETDAEYVHSEELMIRSKVGEWMGCDPSSDAVGTVFNQAINWYNSIPGELDAQGTNARVRELEKYIEYLKEYTKEQRILVHQHLTKIALADGELRMNEVTWLETLRKLLDI